MVLYLSRILRLLESRAGYRKTYVVISQWTFFCSVKNSPNLLMTGCQLWSGFVEAIPTQGLWGKKGYCSWQGPYCPPQLKGWDLGTPQLTRDDHLLPPFFPNPDSYIYVGFTICPSSVNWLIPVSPNFLTVIGLVTVSLPKTLIYWLSLSSIGLWLLKFNLLIYVLL